MTIAVWQNVQVNFQSALDTAVAITAISKADPGVVSYTDTGSDDPADGDYVLLPGLEGMIQLRDRVIRVDGLVGGSDTFELEGEDTTNYATFVAGTFRKIDFGLSASTFTEIDVSGGSQNFLEYGFIHDNVIRKRPTTFENTSFAFTSTFELDNATLASLNNTFKNSGELAMQLILENQNVLVGSGFIGAPLNPLGSKGELVTTEITFDASGLLTGYAS